jgi:hypothetical protein
MQLGASEKDVEFTAVRAKLPGQDAYTSVSKMREK